MFVPMIKKEYVIKYGQFYKIIYCTFLFRGSKNCSNQTSCQLLDNLFSYNEYIANQTDEVYLCSLHGRKQLL